MDHLPVFKDAYSTIPYLGLAFDCDSYDNFPARNGCDKDRLEQGVFDRGHDKAVTAAFLQSWLYFGLLHELSVAGRRGPLKSDHFIKTENDSRVITAKTLDNFIREHVNRLVGAEKKRDALLQRLVAALDSSRQVTDKLWTLYRKDANQSFLPIQVITSIMVLGCTIDGALLETQLTTKQRKWRLSEVAKMIMQNKAWCPRDISLADTFLSELSMYCAAHLRREVAGDSHKRCTDYACEANQINENSYQTQHRTPGCNCNFWQVDGGELQDIIRQGRIPYVQLKWNENAKEGHRFSVSPTLKSHKNSIASGPNNRLVIFSHIWSDGLGNPKQNALPLCQLQNFYDMLADSPWEDVLAEGSMSADKKNKPLIETKGGFPPASARRWNRKHFNKAINIWIDTLCIPLERETKKMAIGMLKRYYSFASMTVVLDKELYQFHRKTISDSELLLRVGLSGWMRRCWTMQEAIIAGGSLRVRLADGWFDLPDTVASLRKKNNISIYLMNDEQQHRISNMRRGLKLFCVPFAACVTCLSAPQMLMEWLPRLIFVRGPRRLWKAMKPEKIPSSSTVFERVATDSKGFFAVITALCQPSPPASSKDPEALRNHVQRITLAWEGLRFRNTSHQADRFINFAFASAKHEDDFTLMKHVLSQPSAERFRFWLQGQKALPSGLMFTEGPRMKEVGYQWAPSDIYSSAIEVYDVATTTKARSKIGAPEGSLEIQKPGFTFTSPFLMDGGSLEIAGRGHTVTYVLEMDWKSSPGGSRQVLKAGVPLAVVLSGHCTPGATATVTAALLVDVGMRRDVCLGEFVCRARVTASPDNGSGFAGQGAVVNQTLPDNQKWVIS